MAFPHEDYANNPPRFARRSEKINEIAAALAKAQGNFASAFKNKRNLHLKTNYADLQSIVDATRPALNDQGISVRGDVVNIDGQTYVTTELLHESGQFMISTFPMNVSTQKGLNDMQAGGSALAYGRRYSWQLACGLATEDDDGQSAKRGGDRQRFTAGPQGNNSRNDGPSRRPKPAPSDNRPQQNQRPNPQQQDDDAPPAWANGQTPAQISGACRAYYSLDEGRSVAAAAAHIGIDGGAIEAGEKIATVVGGLLSPGNADHIINKAMIGAVVKAAIGRDDPEGIDTELLIERVRAVDLASTLSAFPNPQG